MKKKILTAIVLIIFMLVGLSLLDIRPMTYTEIVPFMSASMALGVFLGYGVVIAITFINEAE